MPITVNLRHLAAQDLPLKGEIPADELELNQVDTVIHVSEPVIYDLVAQKMATGILVTGRLTVRLECECVRCLKVFPLLLDLKEFAVELPLEGEEAVVLEGDLADLTPYLREDILLAYPQHPLCEPGCAGLPNQSGVGRENHPGEASQMTSSAWSVLNKLKL